MGQFDEYKLIGIFFDKIKLHRIMSQYFRKYIKKEYFPVHPTQIRFKTNFVNCIQSTMQKRAYRQTQEDDWNIYWCEKEFIPETLDKMRLFPQKRVNHFRNYYELCRKDLLSKNVKKYKRALDKEGKVQEANGYNYLPLTYNLPSEYPIFLEEFKRNIKDKCVWIMKPIGRSQGKGIFLFQKISEISDWSESSTSPQPYIVQRYIHNPLLIGHKKFDLRIYVLVTSHNPLVVYLYRSGFARFTHTRYVSDISVLQGHITNVAFQKNSEGYDQEKGGKYQLDKLRLYMVSKFGEEAVEQCFFNIQQLVIKTLLATSKLMMNDKKCFELYGYDVLIDDKLKPWLVEVNGSPSMTGSTPTDTKMKMGLLDDTLTVVNIQGLLTGDEQQIGGFDLIYKNNKRIKQTTKNKSMLGCYNDRVQKLRKMAKVTALRLAEAKKTGTNSTISNSTQNTNNRRVGGRNFVSSNPVGVNKNGTSNSIHNGGVRNKGPNVSDMVKLPKVTNGSNKNIEIKRPTDPIPRVNNSRDRGRLAL